MMERRRLLLAGLCAALLVSMAAPAAAQQKTPDDQAAEASSGASALLKNAQKQYQNGEWEQARQNYEKAYEAAPDDSKLKARAALEWSSLLWEQGDYAHAARRVDDALERAKKLEMNQAIGQLLLTKGHIEASRGKLRSAENTLKICIEMAGEQKDEVFSSLCRINHRLVRQLRGRPVGPESDYRKAIARLEAAGTPLSVGASLAKTAELYGKTGNPGRALSLLKKAQAEFKKAGSVPAQLRNRLRIARLLQEQNQHVQARKYLEGLVGKFQAMHNRPALVDALVLTAEDARTRGKIGEAAKMYKKALAVAKQTGSPNLIARGHLALCEFGVQTGQGEGVVGDCEVAAKGFDKLDVPELAARANAQLARLYHAKGELNKASAKYSEVIQTLEKTGVPGSADTPQLASYRANLCQVEMSLRSNGALHLCKRALDELDKLSHPDPSMVAATQYAVGVTAGRDGWAGKGVDNLKKAADLAEALTPPDHALAADALLRLGAVLSKMNNKEDDADAAFHRGIAICQKASSPELRATEVQLRIQLAQLEMSRDEYTEAKQNLHKLVEVADGDAASQAWAYNGLARVELVLGNKDAAKKALEKGLPMAEEAGDAALISNFKENLKKFE